MAHRLLTRAGDFDRRAIHARATSLQQAALARGAEGQDVTIAYWLKYCWRVARGQREAAAWLRVEAQARRVLAQSN